MVVVCVCVCVCDCPPSEFELGHNPFETIEASRVGDGDGQGELGRVQTDIGSRSPVTKCKCTPSSTFMTHVNDVDEGYFIAYI